MQTNKRPMPRQTKEPALPQLRQLSIAFDTPVLLGLPDEQRAAAVQALATLLLQASGAHPAEEDDVQP